MRRALGRRPLVAAALSLTGLRPAGACRLALALPPAGAPAAYATPGLLAKLPFGTRSHWLQPWREGGATRPAAGLAAALGAVLEDVTLPAAPAAIATLAQYGLRQLRMEIGWGDVDYATESRFATEGSIRRVLMACRRARLRPLILLNAHHGRPVPHQAREVRLALAAEAGDRSLLVTAPGPVVPRLTGITDPVEKVMAGLMVTAVEGTRLHLSRPVPQSLPAGARLELATLRYEPFSAPGSASNEATLAGWLRYVDLVGELAGAILDPAQGADRGFDLEVWNELTFGSQFLSVGNYYEPRPGETKAQEEAIWSELPARTAAHLADNPARFAGVALVNGFGSTIPWVAASRQHPRVSAIAKHPYPPDRTFPQDHQRGVAALGPDAQPTSFEPAYTAFFPEYQATAIQTETLMRDVSAAPNPIYGAMHGRLARQEEGRPLPVEVWLTEIGVNPNEVGVTDRRAADRLKTKFALRAALFHLGIGVARVYLFNAVGNRGEFALVDATLPDNPTPPLRVLGRCLELLQGSQRARTGGEPLRPLTFAVVPSGAEARPIFAGDGPDRPPLRGSDCLVLLPFQRASGCVAIVYYVMTRDVRVDWPAEQIRVQVGGLGPVERVRAIDPLQNGAAACAAAQPGPGGLLLDLEVTDTPRILLIDCGAADRADADRAAPPPAGTG